MTRRRKILLLTTAIACAGLALGAARARDVPKVATGFIAHTLCSEIFVSGLDPQRDLAETTDAMPGARLLTWAMDFQVDRTRKDVTVSLFGIGRSHAVYRAGLGCTLEHGQGIAEVALPPDDKQPTLLPEIAGPGIVAPQSEGLAAALDRAFTEPAQPPYRHTRAIVVMKDGRIIAERYADGIGPETQLFGFSMTKSVISALTGILVRQGKLKLDGPAPVAAWQNPEDPRHAITVDQLLRHTAGIALGSSLEASLGSALEPVNTMKYATDDMASFAERAPLATAPGTAWNYHDGNFVILAHLLRQAAGGKPADALAFARRELFAPLGMRHVTLQLDASGTIEGSGSMQASARDWARFGQLYLNDGIAGGKRILPEGWVNYSASATPHGWVGIGAGFWTNQGNSFGARFRVDHGWPRDAFFAKGTIGQYTIIIPSERLVIVRMGRSQNWPPEVDGVFDLVRDVVATTREKGKMAGVN
ncbi:serine hydrolase domain-containing protein [Bradyrhizobium guangzhouense]|uniref:Serine hydrolase n=1 Tax=Bradyrhizobium guangzhouense TaxID=1325095 RepID=A0AAE5WVR6_9BRAD|nr:serine hydrolase [Bradyrhizobium guangzhouense]QAU43908.1 serine hydrolase [Bradyrhizobium guangzhouense]RXH17999.1 class C beta-lactamase-related serine hydrolase [Bradyrhizobium guangzhouense]RXH19600.1 class C beta-lactamase-related serine hydrolase [Bradyrhizobium guangzhouense]